MSDQEHLFSGKKNKNFTFRVNLDLLNEAEQLYRKMGLSITEAINVFLQSSVNVGGLPFPLNDSLEAYVQERATKQLWAEIQAGLDADDAYDD